MQPIWPSMPTWLLGQQVCKRKHIDRNDRVRRNDNTDRTRRATNSSTSKHIHNNTRRYINNSIHICTHVLYVPNTRTHTHTHVFVCFYFGFAIAATADKWPAWMGTNENENLYMCNGTWGSEKHEYSRGHIAVSVVLLLHILAVTWDIAGECVSSERFPWCGGRWPDGLAKVWDSR